MLLVKSARYYITQLFKITHQVPKPNLPIQYLITKIYYQI
jgi:hypothetical protein